MIDELLKRLITFILVVYVLMVALNQSIQNPEWVLFVHENPWMMIVLVILAYYVIQWDLRIGLLILLCTMAVYLDIILIKNKDIHNNGATIFNVHSDDTHRK